jgi:hypothetical protein
MIVWSDDCLSCLCNLPHTMEAHMQAVEQAHAELQAEREELRSVHRDLFEDDTDGFSDMDDLEESFDDK